jgi:hypothetical protein
MDRTLLYPVRIDGSPGSSVFDLPVQASNPTPQPRTFAGGRTDGSLRLSIGNHNEAAPDSSPQITVISGGSGGNSICSAFDNACFVLPVSDDGGSSSEIIRVLGGPSIGAHHHSLADHRLVQLTRSIQGDIRSRLVRMIPSAPPTSPLGAVRALLSYRLPANVPEREARAEWRDIVEGQSPLWFGIPNDRKETIRGWFLLIPQKVPRLMCRMLPTVW